MPSSLSLSLCTPQWYLPFYLLKTVRVHCLAPILAHKFIECKDYTLLDFLAQLLAQDNLVNIHRMSTRENPRRRLPRQPCHDGGHQGAQQGSHTHTGLIRESAGPVSMAGMLDWRSPDGNLKKQDIKLEKDQAGQMKQSSRQQRLSSKPLALGGTSHSLAPCASLRHQGKRQVPPLSNGCCLPTPSFQDLQTKAASWPFNMRHAC